MLVSAILVKTTSKGPLIFKQERVGLHNKPFQMYKFRTMYVQTEEEERKGWTQKNDPRVTSVGRFLRKTSLDEFPQLFNVLKGDMSLVGPRPERPQYVEKFREEIPRYMISLWDYWTNRITESRRAWPRIWMRIICTMARWAIGWQ